MICEETTGVESGGSGCRHCLCAGKSGGAVWAFKTACLPNFHLLRQALPKVGKLRKVFFNYCQYSSRYQRYLDGENPNTFNPAFSNGSIMDIGFYCLASAVALFGEPKSVQATASYWQVV